MNTLLGYASPKNIVLGKLMFLDDHNLECLELDEKLRAPASEAGELVQPEPELRAGIPEATDIL